jgi:hypothetical protein
MEFFKSLSLWYNLVFFIPVLIGMVFVFFRLVGFGMENLFELGGAGEVEAEAELDVDTGVEVDTGVDVDADVDIDTGVDVEADVDVDVDVDVDTGVEVEADVDVDTGVEVEADADVDVDAGAEVEAGAEAEGEVETEVETPAGETAASHGVLSSVAAFFNLGRVPFAILLETFLLSFGFLGLFCTTFFRTYYPGADVYYLIRALPIALIGSLFLTKLLGQFFAKYLPIYESKEAKAMGFVGSEATVDSLRLDQKGGRVLLKDAYGDVYTLFCRLKKGEEPVKKKTRIRLVRYIKDKNLYICTRVKEEAEEKK